MQINFKNLTNLLLLLISMAAWWFTAFIINPELQYFLQQTAFLTDPLFFQGFTRYPGGVADYVAVFIDQFFYFKTFGSFLIVLVAATQGIIAMNLVERVAGKVKWNFSIFALILLGSIWVQCDYHYPFYASTRLLFVSAFVWVFTILIQKKQGIRLFIGFMLALLLFYLAGGAALFVFTAAAILIQIRFLVKKTDWFVFPILILFSGVLPYLAYKYFFLVDLSLVYSVTHSKSPHILYYAADYKLFALYSLLPIYLFISVLQYKFRKNTEPGIPQSIETKKELVARSNSEKKVSGKLNKEILVEVQKIKNWDSKYAWLTIQFSVIIAISVISLYLTVDKEERTKTMVSFYGAEYNWAKVIETAQNLKDYDLFTNFEYNKALANTGKLTENIFDYKQLAGSSGLFLDEHLTTDVLFICSDQYYDLGFMYESRHWAFEAQTIFSNSPRLLKRLTLINLINGNYKLVEKFLNQLNKNMLYHDWVKKYSGYLKDPSLIEKDPELAGKRKCEPLGVFSTQLYRYKLAKLLEANPANKMVFDYVLSSVLLDGDLASFNNLLREYPNYLKYPLPRVWDEAYVLFYYLAGKNPEAGDPKFSNAKMQQFKSFVKAMKPFGNDWQTARKSLEKEFGTTYWYYLKCLSPNVTKVQIKKQKFNEEN